MTPSDRAAILRRLRSTVHANYGAYVLRAYMMANCTDIAEALGCSTDALKLDITRQGDENLSSFAIGLCDAPASWSGNPWSNVT